MFDTRTRLFFLACLKDAAGAALKNAAPAPGSGSLLRPKKIGSGSATLKKPQKYPKKTHQKTLKKSLKLKTELITVNFRTLL